MKKILLFGAGKIGRSFIGQLFSQGGYDVAFVDINRDLINALNKNGSYPVVIKSEEGDKILVIDKVKGIYLSDHEKIYQELKNVSYIATAVGNDNLKETIPIIAEGIKRRLEGEIFNPVDIIIAENLRNAADFFEEQLQKFLPYDYIHDYIGLVETSIGKMVPIMTRADLEKDITQVFAEPYNTLILDKKGFKNELPDIRGLDPKENMKAWVDRKSFIHNLGHATAAYFGSLKHPERVYLYEILADEEVRIFTRNTMIQSGKILQKLYPGEFSDSDILEHIDDLIFRFQNKSLGDTVFRVGMDLYRKLGKEDRLAGAIHQAMDLEMPFSDILKSLIYGIHFRAIDENGMPYTHDIKFNGLYTQFGLEYILENICGFDPVIHSDVFTLSKNYNIEILSRFNKNLSMLLLKDLPDEETLLEEYYNPFADPPLLTNAHFHTPFSFSAFNTMTEIFNQANKEDIDVLGINDFITMEGYDEFYRLAYEHKKFPLFNIEFMGLMKEEQEKGIRINDPNNPGRVYFCGKGLAFPVNLSESIRETLESTTQNSLRQTEQMASLLNKYLKKIKSPFILDFKEIQANYTKGLVRERHLAKALRIKISEHYKTKKGIETFLKKLYGGKNSEVNIDIPGDLDNEIRGNLLKKGGIAFVEEDNDAFLSLAEIMDIILGAQGIPCYPVLLDDAAGKYTDFEKDFSELLKSLTKNRVFAVELIPGRNDFSIVKDFVSVFSEKGFIITFGTEHNTSDPAPLKVSCRDNVPLDKDLLGVNYQSACVIAAHQYFVARGEPGYLTPEGFPRLEKQDDFIAIGNAVIRNFIKK